MSLVQRRKTILYTLMAYYGYSAINTNSITTTTTTATAFKSVMIGTDCDCDDDDDDDDENSKTRRRGERERRNNLKLNNRNTATTKNMLSSVWTKNFLLCDDVRRERSGEEEQERLSRRRGKKEASHTAQWRVYTDLAREKFIAGDIEFALKCFERALKEAKLGFGEKDAHVAAALNNLAELARTQRMWEKAEGLYKECIDLLIELNEEDKEKEKEKKKKMIQKQQVVVVQKNKGAYKADATIAAALHNLASCKLQNNKPEQAYENYQTSLNLKQKCFENENHPEIALTLHHMAEALIVLERVDDAIIVLERSVKITDAVGIGHTQTQFKRMRRLMQLYEMTGGKRADDVAKMKKRIENQFSI
jgi:tetratricopeptide (TPR) repeat protein